MTEHISPDLTPGSRPDGISLFDLVGGLSSAMDLISPQVVDHHTRVTAVAARLGQVLGLNPMALAELTLAGLTHDIGAFSLRVRLDALEFETDQVMHAEVGWRLLRSFPGFERIAGIIRHHHLRHDQSAEADAAPDVLDAAKLLHLADRVDVRLRSPQAPSDLASIHAILAPHAGTWFAPAHVEALGELAAGPDFLQGMRAEDERAFLKGLAAPLDESLDMTGALRFSELFSQIIDFRSRFTATHSRGVAASAGALLRLAGGDGLSLRTMAVAGNLHDLGKLAVPQAILEKPGPLDDAEFTRMRAHADHTLAVLSGIPGLETVAAWAGNHHERLDGRGYPRHLDAPALDRGSRIMAVADVFTALTEDRPYRAGMNREAALKVLKSMAVENALDPEAVSLLTRNFEELNAVRVLAQDRALADFKSFASRS
ncbi:HD domain-containing phosphohydrolase [Desulfocurvus sp. DL9XJH121]